MFASGKLFWSTLHSSQARDHTYQISRHSTLSYACMIITSYYRRYMAMRKQVVQYLKALHAHNVSLCPIPLRRESGAAWYYSFKHNLYYTIHIMQPLYKVYTFPVCLVFLFILVTHLAPSI